MGETLRGRWQALRVLSGAALAGSAGRVVGALAGVIVVIVVTVPAVTSAHGLTAGQGSLQVIGDTVQLTITPYAATFRSADTDGDGLLSLEEVNAGRRSILAEVDKKVALLNQAGTAAERTFADVIVGRDHHTGTEGDFVKVICRYRWKAAPSAVTLKYSLFSGADDPGLSMMVSRSERDIDGRLVPVKGGAPRVIAVTPAVTTWRVVGG